MPIALCLHRCTPLFLAIRLRHLDAARLLVAAGAACGVRDGSGSMALLEAAQLRGGAAEPLLEEMMLSHRRSHWVRWERKWPALQAALEALPDFEVRATPDPNPDPNLTFILQPLEI